MRMVAPKSARKSSTRRRSAAITWRSGCRGRRWLRCSLGGCRLRRRRPRGPPGDALHLLDGHRPALEREEAGCRVVDGDLDGLWDRRVADALLEPRAARVEP